MISKFIKTSTSIWDDDISSIIYISENGEMNEDEIFTYIEKGTIDSVIIDGDEPVRLHDTIAIAKKIKKSKLKIKIVTKGNCPDGLDDFIGACYADSVKMNIDSKIDEKMKKTVEIIFNSGMEHEFSIILNRKKLSDSDIAEILHAIKGAKRLSLIVPNDAKEFTKSEIAKIGSDAKTYVKEVKIINA